MDKIRLQIISEDFSVRQGLDAIFRSEVIFDILGSFSVKEALDKCLDLQPDAVIFDMPGKISEYEQEIAAIKSECPCTLIIALVQNSHYKELHEIVAKGVDGCVFRGIMRGCLVKAVELACRAGVFCLPGHLKKTFYHSSPGWFSGSVPSQRQVSGGGNTLTRRELEILHLMAKNCSNRDIVNELFISEPTVKTHVSNILRKLGQKNRAQAVLYAYKAGLLKQQ